MVAWNQALSSVDYYNNTLVVRIVTMKPCFYVFFSLTILYSLNSLPQLEQDFECRKLNCGSLITALRTMRIYFTKLDLLGGVKFYTLHLVYPSKKKEFKDRSTCGGIILSLEPLSRTLTLCN